MSELVQPTRIEKTDQREIRIEWSDGQIQEIPFRNLRDGCQCATCMDERMKPKDKPAGQLTVLSPEQARPMDVLEMQPVGNYAYNIRFSDGHSTGIFTFEQLRALKS